MRRMGTMQGPVPQRLPILVPPAHSSTGAKGFGLGKRKEGRTRSKSLQVILPSF